MAEYMEGYSEDRTEADTYELYDPRAPLSEVTDFSIGRKITPTEAREATLPPVYHPVARQRQLDRLGRCFGTNIVGSASALPPFPKYVASHRDLVRKAEIAEEVDRVYGPLFRSWSERPELESSEVVRDELGNPLADWPTMEPAELPTPDDLR